MFCLCRHNESGKCTHSDEERCIVGAWVVDEVRKAVDFGCGVMDKIDFWEYEVTCLDKYTNTGGTLAELVNTFLKLKRESSDYPTWVQREEDKDRYIEDYRRVEGIILDKVYISKNAGEHIFAKLKLNSNWGKWDRTKRRP